jgi:hypothetical protein
VSGSSRLRSRDLAGDALAATSRWEPRRRPLTHLGLALPSRPDATRPPARSRLLAGWVFIKKPMLPTPKVPRDH